VGPAKTRKTAIEAGYPSNTRGLEDNLANVLGTASPRVIDVADAFATFAAQGKQADAYTVKRVTSQDGKVDYRADVRPKRVFSRDSSRDLTYALQGVVERGSGAYAGSNLGRPAAGKTGTSQDNRSAWFAGYTPQLAAAIGMYRGGVKDGQAVQLSLNGLGGLSEVTGGSIPVRVWTAFMEGALEGTDVEDFPAPTFGGRSNAPLTTSTFSSSSTTTSEPSTTTTRTRTESPSSSPTSSSTSPTESPSSTATSSPTSTRTTSSPTRTRQPTTSPTSQGNRVNGATRTQRPTTRPADATSAD
jgi:membrane peptidoglycan carboxypeptidase